jgi:phenylalanyl-tRNA synthetase beta chain
MAVDASNLVLHECGHPNHVFDRRKIEGQQIILRKAKANEKFTTLDDKTHELNADHLLVADARGGIALAGIMGGANSEVDPDTSDLLLEIAVFDPGTIRRGRRAVNMNTDASYRFERGVDFQRAPWVSRRLAHLITASCGGKASPRLIEAQGEPMPPPARFFVRAAQVKRVAGVDLPPSELASMMERLQIPAVVRGEGIEVEQPSFRHDLLEEVDVVEEVARLHGYDEIPTRSRAPMLRPAERTPVEKLSRRLRQSLAGRGFHEAVTSSFMDDADADRLRLPDGDPRRSAVKVLNPIAQGQGRLRTSAVPELMRILERNRSRGVLGPIRLFQLGRCFHPVAGEPLPDERVQVVMAWNGPAEPAHFAAPDRSFDLYDVCGELEGLLGELGWTVQRNPRGREPYHEPGTTLEVWAAERRLGVMGAVAAKVLDAFDVPGATFVAELDLQTLVDTTRTEVRFRPFSAYPPVRRDLSLVMPKSVPFAAVDECLRAVFEDLLESRDVFDLYEGPGLDDADRAVGVRLSLRSAEGTLKDAKVDALLQTLLRDLDQKHGIRLR